MSSMIPIVRIVLMLIVAAGVVYFSASADSPIKREEIRDPRDFLIGTIRPLPDGTLEARDRLGRLQGRYLPRTGETRDPQNRLLTKGNSLSALLLCNFAGDR